VWGAIIDQKNYGKEEIIPLRGRDKGQGTSFKSLFLFFTIPQTRPACGRQVHAKQYKLKPLFHQLYHNAGCSPRDRKQYIHEAVYMDESGMGPCFSRVVGET